MRGRWLAACGVALLVAGASACGGDDDAVAPPVTTDPLDDAVEIAQIQVPAGHADAEVARLIDALCDSAASGDAASFLDDLHVAGLDGPEQLTPALDGLEAGADGYCPDDVDPVLAVAQAAAAPTTTSAAATSGAETSTVVGSGPSNGATSSGSGSGSAGSGTGSSSAGTAGSSTTVAGASNSSGGSSSSGGGNATGTGNSSDTGFTQSMGSSGSSNSTPAP